MEDVAYLLRGRVRRKTLISIKNEPKTATEISKDVNKHRSSISRVLANLVDDGYARCDNPKDDKYRFYSITGDGLKLLEKTEKYLRKTDGKI